MSVTSRALVLIIGCIILQSCASYGQHATSMRDSLLMGLPEQSLALAEQEDIEQEEVLASLDKGMLRRINGDFEGSNRIFEVAKGEIEELYGISLTENLASVTVNETFRGYEGDRYEQLLLHAYMAMNYIELGMFDSARVEMQQANIKMMEWGDEPEEDAWLRYLEGMIYERLGEIDNALISYRKAYTVYQENGGEHYPVMPDQLKRDLLRLLAWQGLWDEYRRLKTEFEMEDYTAWKPSRDYGELILILNNGLAPIRSQTAIPIWSTEVQQNLRVAFPVYKEPKKTLKVPLLTVNDKSYSLETVEDVDALARYSLERAMPGIMARAMARAVVKYNTQSQANDNSALAGLLMTVTNIATEQADTRSWSTLPQEIQLRRLLLPVGEHSIRLEMRGPAGNLVDVISHQVEIEPERQTFVIKHHWGTPPRQKPVAQKMAVTAR